MSEQMTANTEKKEKIAFVICPIGDRDTAIRKRSDQMLKYIITPVVEKFGYKPIRADEIPKPGTITSQIVEHILDDPLVIADLTGRNANVFYELAVRHIIEKPTIQIIEKGETIPFDVVTQRTIEIDHKDLDSVEEAKKSLEKQIAAVEKDPTLVDSPIRTAVNMKSLRASSNPEQAVLATIQASMAEFRTEIREIRDSIRHDRLLRKRSDMEAHLLKDIRFSYEDLLGRIEEVSKKERQKSQK